MSRPIPGILFVISAPSGAGKTSLVRALVSSVPALRVSVSHTTRARRPSEREGRDYHFVSQADFEKLIDDDGLLEHAMVFGYYYGTTKSWVANALATGADVILEIDWQGARQVREAFPDCVSVEVFPPSLDSLEQRLRGRGQDSEATIKRRMNECVEEMRHYLEFDYLIINDDFQTALNELTAVVTAERTRTDRKAHRHRGLVEHLLGNVGSTVGEPLPAGSGPPAPKRAGGRFG